ncbi:MAG TPA: hypothetical protein VK588_15920 [Chitinophagaceae bacterium]|nr:hypothetical protein [Chitinophagaceae bacterium]
MNTPVVLIKSIFHKDSLQDCSLEEIQTTARQYPYFTPVQFLLAEKLKSGNTDLFNKQIEVLSLHFNNPLWLDFLLNRTKTEMAPEEATTSPIETNQETAEKQESTEVPASETFLTSGEETTQPSIIGNSEGMIDNDFEGSASNSQEEKMETEIPTAGNHDDTGTDQPIEPKEEINEPSMFTSPLDKLKQEAVEGELTFEPYHTVDYFASQGIKFITEEKPTDRFGQQLKSFTEWLKAMKRLPVAETMKLSDPPSEEKVEQLANRSINESEVTTEAMAEVWLKQGNKEKAAEIYSKLSLLNPSKTAYFASLAEQIKNS